MEENGKLKTTPKTIDSKLESELNCIHDRLKSLSYSLDAYLNGNEKDSAALWGISDYLKDEIKQLKQLLEG